MNKQQMVERLVSHCLQSLSEDHASASLQKIYGKDFGAFARMSERRLKRELEFRGIAAFDEPEDLDEMADFEPSAVQLMGLLSRSTGASAIEM